MRILHLTPGTGSFHCGSCLRDNALIKALRARGHDASIVPLYLPLVTDGEEASPQTSVKVGGVSLYLQQKFSKPMSSSPRWLKGLLDSAPVLKFASKFIGMTSPKDLGEMTVGSLLGDRGTQWPEWERLVDWVVKEERPDVISLSNSLLSGLAPAFAKRLGVPVVCSLQGEDAFLDSLISPWKEQAWDLLRENAKYIAHFAAPSSYYASVMLERLGVPESQVTVVPNGLNFSLFEGKRRVSTDPTIGFLARMIHGKGLSSLVDAFIRLKRWNRIPRLKLRLAGSYLPSDEPYHEELRAKLRNAGFLEDVSWEPNLSFEEKVKFLHELSVLSVPAHYGEAFGLYVIEAQACGLPVVQPNTAAFPEILGHTQGGLLYDMNAPDGLASALEEFFLLSSQEVAQLSNRAKENARHIYSAERMAEMFEKLL